ncbi:MAG TPA: hypothetical protein PLX15_02010 [Candidatus Woesearchaeota archaeon]|nr:hypothetical protein [Candidatus Woesearchaeota archaeon]
MIVGNGFIDKKFGKNTLVGVVLVFMFLLMLSFSFAKENSQSDIVNLTNTKDGTGNIVSVYFFWGEGCPHCIDQKPFMDELKAKYGEKINIHSYETWNNPENAKIFQEIAKAYDTSARGVPTTFIGDKFWVGFSNSMKTDFVSKIDSCINEGCISPLEETNDLKDKRIDSDIHQDYISLISDGNYTKTGVCVHVFVDYECSDCEEIKNYIASLDISNVYVTYHNVNEALEKEIYDEFKKIYGLKTGGFPTVFIGDSYLIGINSIRKNFQNSVNQCIAKNCPCPAEIIKATTPSMPKGDFKPEKTEVIEIPFIGSVDIGKMPLFVMTALIAFVDGFNPCSLWVLTFLLGIVIYTGSRKKILLVGLTFLFVASLVYGLFMLGLLNVFSYVGYTFWIKLGVSLIACVFAIVNIKDYFWYKKGISFTISDRHKPKLFKKIRGIMDPNKSTISMILATALMALGVTLVELPCTAGFPMIWTNIVSSSNVPITTFGLLFLLYILIYLVDELVVFIGVALTLKASKFEEKHGRILKLIGGMIMLSLAFALLFLPDMMNSVKGSLYVFGSALLISIAILLIHRKLLPRLGVKIGSEEIEVADKEKIEDDDNDEFEDIKEKSDNIDSQKGVIINEKEQKE